MGTAYCGHGRPLSASGSRQGAGRLLMVGGPTKLYSQCTDRVEARKAWNAMHWPLQVAAHCIASGCDSTLREEYWGPMFTGRTPRRDSAVGILTACLTKGTARWLLFDTTQLLPPTNTYGGTGRLSRVYLERLLISSSGTKLSSI